VSVSDIIQINIKLFLAIIHQVISVALIMLSPLAICETPRKYLVMKRYRGDVDSIVLLAEGMDLNEFYRKDKTFLSYAILVKQHKSYFSSS